MDRRVGKTKEAVRGAYYELLMDKSVKRITVKDIAERANIDRKTFYLHYGEPDDVLREFCELKVRDALLLLERNDYFENPSDISAVIQALQYLVEEDLAFFTRMAANTEHDFFWDRLYEILLQTVLEVYGEEADVDPLRLKVCGEFYIAGGLRVIRDSLTRGNELSFPQVNEVLSDIAGKGMLEAIRKNEKLH